MRNKSLIKIYHFSLYKTVSEKIFDSNNAAALPHWLEFSGKRLALQHGL